MSEDSEHQDDTVKRLIRLSGDECKAERAIQRLHSIIEKMDVAGLKMESEVFKAMADPCRLTILRLLKEGEFCACEVTTALGRPQSSISHHITILKEAGLINERKVGKWSRYRLSDGAVVEMMNLAELLAERL
ncbi:MAG: ArsR/SmtB family transcription factor [Methanotrichaceae archaeon]